jgi:hypothetical protein
MNIKKALLTSVLALFIAASGFSQAMNLGIMGTYNPFNPSFWSAGYMGSFTGDYSGNSAHFARVGMTVGAITLTYEKENPLTSKHEMTEYWQKSTYMDWLFGYVFQAGFTKIFAFRLGADFYFSYASAYVHSDFNTSMAFNTGLTAIAGLSLLPKGVFTVNIDACPGYTLNPFGKGAGVFAFIVPIRLSAGINL